MPGVLNNACLGCALFMSTKRAFVDGKDASKLPATLNATLGSNEGVSWKTAVDFVSVGWTKMKSDHVGRNDSQADCGQGTARSDIESNLLVASRVHRRSKRVFAQPADF